MLDNYSLVHMVSVISLLWRINFNSNLTPIWHVHLEVYRYDIITLSISLFSYSLITAHVHKPRYDSQIFISRYDSQIFISDSFVNSIRGSLAPNLNRIVLGLIIFQ